MASSKTKRFEDDAKVIDFIKLFPSLKITDDAFSKAKKVKCSLTGHELPCRLAELEKYTNGKRFKTAQDRDKDKFEQYKPHIVPSTKKGRENQLFCTLTVRHINRVPAHVERHVNGRRYKKALEKYEECQRQGIKFKPLARSKKKESDSDIKKYSHHADSDTSDSEDESDDSMSDLYPREYFERLQDGGEGEDDDDSDFDIENNDCGLSTQNESKPTPSGQAKRKNKSKKGGRRKFAKTQSTHLSQNGMTEKKGKRRKGTGMT
ncbi:surfeit locus protein 2-like [Lytechinus pictus]|uniref:surfeit locus protein 2-like n=1 Tax=Lytechinus pictus TaxID=7653 RepID=UPI0030B9F13D